MLEFNNYNPNLNPKHPMRGNEAFLVVEYTAYVGSPDSNVLHPSPFIKKQSWKTYISSKKSDKSDVSGAKGDGFDGIVKLYVDIDGIEAISSGEVKSGWDRWIHILSSFGVKCDDANHDIQIHVKQFVAMQPLQQWQEIFRKSHQLKFDQSNAKKEEDIREKKDGSLSKVKKAILGK